ncbi:MAG: response regulator [Rhodocyclaceae bacterium]|nr:response regulator [Rhodocyclaceae bacterium]
MNHAAQLDPSRRGKILCVDDEPGIVRALDWLLRRNFEVVTATSGEAAVSLIQQHDFDVIISDQRMPGMTGVELLKTAKRLAPRAMRILLTGYSDLQAVLASVNEGEVFRFINKPWNVDELPVVVGQAVGLSRTAVPAPADPEHSVDPEAPPPDEPVLLVDSDEKVHEAFAEALADQGVKIRHASTLNEAVQILDREEVGVIVSDTRVGGFDVTRLIRMLKARQPEIVSVVLSKESDAETITTLINQGQIYRYVPKPIRPGYMRLVVNSALGKHRQMRQNPEIAQRHQVQQMAESLAASLEQELAFAGGGGGPGPAAAGGGGFVRGIVSSFRRLFGR